MLGNSPICKVHIPLERNDHPKLNTSDLLKFGGIEKYQSLFGSLQWAVSLGRLDIGTAVMTLLSYCSAPKQGHLDRAKRVVGYLFKIFHATIHFKTRIPSYFDLPNIRHTWEKSIMEKLKSILVIPL